MNSNDQTPVYVFNTHADAAEAIRLLGKASFDVKKLSVIERGYHSEDHPVGFYTSGDRIKSWGGIGAFWGGIWGILLAPAVFFIPGFGLMGVGGPLVTVLVSALEGSVVVGGLSALGAALTQIGVSKGQAIEYEAALKAYKFVLMVHGNDVDLKKAGAVLESFGTLEAA